MNQPAPAESTPPRVPRDRAVEYLLTVASSWLLPGAGHWMLGQRARGAMLGVLILGLFWLGQHGADYRAINREIHPIFFCAQVGNGFSTLLSQKLWGEMKPKPAGVDRTIAPHHNMGILLTSISGLLNILLILHAADPRSWSPRGEDGETRPGDRGHGTAREEVP